MPRTAVPPPALPTQVTDPNSDAATLRSQFERDPSPEVGVAILRHPNVDESTAQLIVNRLPNFDLVFEAALGHPAFAFWSLATDHDFAILVARQARISLLYNTKIRAEDRWSTTTKVTVALHMLVELFAHLGDTEREAMHRAVLRLLVEREQKAPLVTRDVCVAYRVARLDLLPDDAYVATLEDQFWSTRASVGDMVDQILTSFSQPIVVKMHLDESMVKISLIRLMSSILFGPRITKGYWWGSDELPIVSWCNMTTKRSFRKPVFSSRASVGDALADVVARKPARR